MSTDPKLSAKKEPFISRRVIVTRGIPAVVAGAVLEWAFHPDYSYDVPANDPAQGQDDMKATAQALAVRATELAEEHQRATATAGHTSIELDPASDTTSSPTETAHGQRTLPRRTVGSEWKR